MVGTQCSCYLLIVVMFEVYTESFHAVLYIHVRRCGEVPVGTKIEQVVHMVRVWYQNTGWQRPVKLVASYPKVD